jgi:hypothetical protein
LRVILLAIWACLHLAAQVANPPKFSDFKAMEIYHGKRAAPRVKHDKREYHGFRAVLTDADKSPNFAGKYVISEDTCGTDSVRLMTADAEAGSVHEEFCIFWAYSITRRDLPSGLEYRADSKLLIAHGCWDDEKLPECGDHFFKMTRGGLHEIRWIPFNPPVPTSR